MVLLKRYKKPWLALSAALIIIGVAVIAAAWLYAPAKKPTVTLEIDVAGYVKVIRAELVTAPADMYRGLSGRKSLCASCGMLFYFGESGIRQFVMRDMNFPLDIIFINEGRIIYIAANKAPEGPEPVNVYGAGPADQVLEVNGGWAAREGVKVGDMIRSSSNNF